jgi:hypothetical protein
LTNGTIASLTFFGRLTHRLTPKNGVSQPSSESMVHLMHDIEHRLLTVNATANDAIDTLSDTITDNVTGVVTDAVTDLVTD